MKAITLRNIPVKVAQKLRDRARRDSLSLNRTVLRVLEEAFGVEPRARAPRVHRDLDALIGSWSRRDARDFDRALADLRRVDPELWR